MRENWKIIIIIICVIALGGLIELLKSTGMEKPERSFTAKELKELDFQPYHYKSGKIANQKAMRFYQQKLNKNAKSVKTLQKHNFKHQVIKAPPSPIKKKKVKKTKKKLVKNKSNPHKQKKKSKKNKENSVDRENESQETDTYARKNTQSILPATPMEPTGERSDIPNAEEWLRRVLARPSLEETTKLIKYYQSNLITAAVFYSVVEQMLESSSERMRSLGIKAAGSTPNYHSFILLANLVQEEPFGSTIRSESNQALKRYTQLAYLNILKIVMYSQENPTVCEKALILLVDSARKNLATAVNSSQPNPIQQKYSDILTILEHVLSAKAHQETSPIFTTLQDTIDTLRLLLRA